MINPEGDYEMSLEEKSKTSLQDTVQNVLTNFTAAANADAVFQKPILHGDQMMIPAAEIVSLVGFGVGEGGETDEQSSDTGGGGAGGGSVFTRPVAVIVASPDGVQIEPVIDLTKIALAGLTTGLIFLGSFLRLLSLRRKIEDVQKEMIKPL